MDFQEATALTIGERVMNGLAWLDEHGARYGLDLARVDVATLDMSDGRRCVLGQARDPRRPAARVSWVSSDSGFGLIMDEVSSTTDTPWSWDWAWAYDNGFALEGGEGDPSWGELTDAWRGVIVARRVALPCGCMPGATHNLDCSEHYAG